MPSEEGATKLSLSSILVHPDWSSEDPRFDADISLVILVHDVIFNEKVEPICLPKASLTEPVGMGTVAGWGLSEHSLTMGQMMDHTPNELEVPIIERGDCFLDVPELAKIASRRTFCAGFVDQSKSVCPGDSGSGLVTFVREFGRYEVKGIVSSSLRDSTGTCNTEIYALYTNVAKFVDWINEKTIEERTGENQEGQESFKCQKDELQPTQEVECRQEEWPTEQNCVSFELVSNNLINDISTKFSQLKSLSIQSNSLKLIERRHFEHLKNLEKLTIFSSQIEFLNANFLWDLTNLKKLAIYRNKIKKLPEKLFEKQKKVEFMDFKSNNIDYLPENLFKFNLDLKAIDLSKNPLKKIDVDFTRLPKLMDLSMLRCGCISAWALQRASIFELQHKINQNCASISE